MRNPCSWTKALKRSYPSWRIQGGSPHSKQAMTVLLLASARGILAVRANDSNSPPGESKRYPRKITKIKTKQMSQLVNRSQYIISWMEKRRPSTSKLMTEANMILVDCLECCDVSCNVYRTNAQPSICFYPRVRICWSSGELRESSFTIFFVRGPTIYETSGLKCYLWCYCFELQGTPESSFKGAVLLEIWKIFKTIYGLTFIS